MAERMRVQGNTAFKAKQYSEALRCYQQGLSSEKTNMTLHANAAQAALKINCNVAAIEHCDKVRAPRRHPPPVVPLVGGGRGFQCIMPP